MWVLIQSLPLRPHGRGLVSSLYNLSNCAKERWRPPRTSGGFHGVTFITFANDNNWRNANRRKSDVPWLSRIHRPDTDRAACSFPPVRRRRVRRRSRNPAHLLFPISGLLLGLPWAGERGCIPAIAFSLSPWGWCEVVRFAAEDSGLPRIIAAVQEHISTRDTW